MERKYIRLLIDNTKFIVTENYERMEYVRVSPKRTGLPYDIYIDNNMSYKTYNHELWMYVNCDGIMIPITIDDKPKVKRFVYGLRYDLSMVYDFIRINKELLSNMANRKTNEHVFFHLLKRVNESHCDDSSLINEMATLHMDVSHLPTTLWIDDDKTYLPHAPRVKFKTDNSQNTRQYASMEINNPEKLHNFPKKSYLNSSDIEQIRAFVRVNRQILIDLCNKKIEFEDFKKMMKLVNRNGEIITQDFNIGKFVNGFALYFENGKYNYIKPNGEMLFDETNLDYAQNFECYGEGILMAYVTKGDRSFYINENGEEVNFD